ncbi:MAG: hypothetical protein M9926_16595 [Lentimicrobium sp.]|mgnify:CR=1 FL=1|uniref:hypothetical protein n=2 Tax=Lentimicrobium sp. TaxID=2034841 RepID=UPI0025FA8450|nr:hypothetical protein [Lentimicrobium sp.]MCO5258367.1 hypothetical protein [Lentimicrobium sp.]MCO5264165.1 hypothetical protein [Lentimicrobium sp.]HPF65924.1 hypothetical protein [Lentimicrobium sp.]HRW70603.1 hypothetical protein [Lentimicrobium sp.]
MKSKLLLIMITGLMFLAVSCGKDNEGNDNDKSGVLRFKTYNPLAGNLKMHPLKAVATTNPPLTGPTTVTETTSFMLCVGDVWVSQGEVKAGQPDNLDWERLTTVTNKEHMLFEDYAFSDIELPAGSYKSIKLTFRNVFYRYARLVADPAVAYELLETMGSWTSPCDENDTTWAMTNYFGPDGNHILGNGGTFELVSEGEKLGGFTIEEGRVANVTWRLGAGVTEPCTTYLIDENNNLQWDCGVDRMEFECPPDAEYMWDFVIEYQ